MFILYAMPVGIAVGYLLGGRLDRLAGLRFRWGGLAILGLVVQVVLFSPIVAPLVTGGVGEALYIGSTGVVLLAVVRNLRLPGLAFVALGALGNLAAILANGGVMPTTAAAVATAGLDTDPGFSNSMIVADPRLAPLTDIFALPAWVPLANVFSVGDVLIGLGVGVVIVIGMRRDGPAPTEAHEAGSAD